MNKEYKIKLDLNKKLYNKKMAFNQFDENVNDFYIEITKNNEIVKDLDKAIVVLAVIKPNKEVDSQFVEVENGVVYANLKPNMKDEIGTYTAQAMLILEDERVVTDSISYEVEEDKIFSLLNDTVETTEEFTLLTDMLSRLSNIETNEEQRMINEAERILSEENRKIEEAKRVEAELIRQHEEADRAKYDATRESNENIRKQNESIRLANETNRIDEEAKRVEEETKRVEAEQLRKDNYNFMTEDEERRRSEANAHKEAEALRVQAETNRVNEEAKRRTTEQARVSAENTRVSNENTREANEVTRQTNETQRVEAETQRQNRYNSFIADAEANASNFENYTNTAKVKEEERKANELDRKSQEDRRVSNEVERISNENTRKANEVVREKNETSRQYVFENKVNEVDTKISELNTTKDNFVSSIHTKVDTKISELDNAKSDMTTTVSNKVNEVETRFNTLTSTQQQDAEVIDARDGEVSLKARLDRDLYKDGISLSDRIEAIEGLKDSQNMKYETDKGYLVCKETKNGVIDDLKIEGKTLVNLWDITKMNKTSAIVVADNYVTVNADGSWIDCHPIYAKNTVSSILKPDTEYTIITHIKTNTLNGAFCVNIDSTNRSPYTSYYTLDIGFTGYHIRKLRTKTDLSGADTTLRCQVGNSCTTGQIIFNCIVLEGDHTQNPPSYFEGLMSVGQDVDKIEVLSNNKNLFSGEIRTGRYDENGTFHSDNRMWATTKFLLPPNKNFKVSCKRLNTLWVNFWTKEDIHIKQLTLYSNDVLTTPLGAYKCSITSSIDYDLEDLQIEEGTQITSYIPHQSDKKQILFYNENGELEPVTELHEWDSIEKHSDNKWYYHKRSGKVVLNGSEEFYMIDVNDKPNTLLFHTDANFIPSANVIKDSICDKLALNKTISGVDVESHLVAETSRIYIRLLKSKLSTQDVTGFKQWLQANNVTVVYQLAQEEVYELAPLHLDSYANETLILCNSGAISPKMEFSITSHINELVKAYGERINLLEEKVYKYMVTQNRMQLASTYSADSVTFKVDYFSLCGDEENYDEDLYNLILNNILVGKDNYDYDKMFTIILDYASWNQISWGQFDILVGLMDMQHNPPVEELPPEDEIEEDIIEEDIIENEETPVE